MRLILPRLVLLSVALLPLLPNNALAETGGQNGESSGSASSDGQRADVLAQQNPGNGSGPGSSTGGTGGTRVCQFVDAGDELEMRPNVGIVPQSNEPVTEFVVEHYYLIRCSVNGGPFEPWRVWQAQPDTPPVSPLALALQAYDTLTPAKPTPRWNPEGTQLVGFATWLWVDDSMWEPFSASASVPGLTVTATATPTEVKWDPGDGSEPIVCDGPGTPYRKEVKMKHQRTDCKHVYQYFGSYQGSATVTWAVEWTTSNGGGGTLNPLTTTTEFEMNVGDREAVGR